MAEKIRKTVPSCVVNVYDIDNTAKMLREAKAAGCTCLGGKGMLMWQAVAGFKEIMGQDMPVEEVRKKFYS